MAQTLQDKHLEYWTDFNDFLKAESELFRQGTLRQKGPEPHMHQTFIFGPPWTTIAFECLANRIDQGTRKGSARPTIPVKSIATALTIRKAINGVSPTELIASLQQERGAIENALGELRWPDEDTKGTRRVVLLLKVGEDPEDRSRRQLQYCWFTEKLEAFYRVFPPRIERAVAASS